MNGPSDRWAEADKIADLALRVLTETGAFIHAVPYRTEQYNEHSPLMRGIRREELDL